MRLTLLSLLQRSTALAAAALLAACASKPAAVAPVEAAQGAQTTQITATQKFFWFFSPYRPDIQQGNFVSQEMLGQLKNGMSKDQVKFLLGTPLDGGRLPRPALGLPVPPGQGQWRADHQHRGGVLRQG
ncbi:outer membrane protein assembly factor BamE [Massilia eburnea]|uniref:outer membrane protein assembly factor BamE n=1 Tax=Massilia eburnea TaxID=1776165 RepID=UPI003D6C6830